ncbi:MAG: hypothetical protein M1826_002809 [Phylliscum demangeonii]|nr:MAG: hypothetical protein M1826_002809 [Phylliscum demangeonii]
MASHHCHDEQDHDHDGHDHNHNHNHTHNHDDERTPATQSYLYQQIDFSAIVTLNEAEPGSGAAIVRKGWTKRMDPTPEVASDADDQLLMFIPFTGQVKLHALLLRTSDSGAAPATVKLLLNREDVLDFGAAADMPPTQTLALPRTSELQEIPLKRARFNATRCLTLFFERNHAGEGGEGEEATRVAFVGFKGDWMQVGREPVAFVYEAAAKPSDHPMVVGVGPKGAWMGQGVGGAREGR